MKMKLKIFNKNFINKDKSKKFKNSYIYTIITILIFSLINTYIIFNQEGKIIKKTKLKVGDIVHQDIVIQKDLTIEDKEATQEKLEEIKSKAVPIYEKHNIEDTVFLRIEDWFNYINQRNFLKNIKISKRLAEIKEKFKIEISKEELRFILKKSLFKRINNQLIRKILKKMYLKGVMLSKSTAKKSKNNEIIITKDNREKIIKLTEIYEIRDIENQLTELLKRLNFNEKEIKISLKILKNFIDINLSFSPALTQQRLSNELSQVNPVVIKLKKGKIILRKGDEVRKDDIKILKLISKEEEIQEKKISQAYLIFIVIFIIILLIKRLYLKWEVGGINKEKIFTITLFTLTISTLFYRITIFLTPLVLKNISISFNYTQSSLCYILPFGMGALVFAFIYNLQSSYIFAIINSIFGGLICNWNPYIMVYIFITTIIAVIGLEYYGREKRSSIFRVSILWLMPTNILMILLITITQNIFTFSIIFFNVLMGIFSAILSPILANFIIPTLESLFNLITDLKLNELTNLNLPIFREMAEKAPGTYHHSQMVASLAEEAANDLKLPPLLLRAMALYHDIGKIEHPELFTENSSIYPDIHKSLTPEESSKQIISHIKIGLEKAESIGLPDFIKQAIEQHHGTKLVRYFYNKAKEELNGKEEINEEDFRYNGKKPQNIENAIIMLADQIEAASKSISNPTNDDIENVIKKIININIEEDQFSECEGLTFKALNIISLSFKRKLASIYHHRISYPGIDFKEKEEENEENDKDNKE